MLGQLRERLDRSFELGVNFNTYSYQYIVAYGILLLKLLFFSLNFW